MRLTILLPVVALAGCSQPQKPVAPEPVRIQRLPSATEVFNLRSKCAQLGRDLNKDKDYRALLNQNMGSNYKIYQSMKSNYSIEANRCYVRIENSVNPGENTKHFQLYAVSLYDGQTGDLLADIRMEGPAFEKKDYGGTVVGDSSIGSGCNEDGGCGYHRVYAYIDERMKREE